MSQGVILLVVIALIITYIVARTRRRMGFLVTAQDLARRDGRRHARRARAVGGARRTDREPSPRGWPGSQLTSRPGARPTAACSADRARP